MMLMDPCGSLWIHKNHHSSSFILIPSELSTSSQSFDPILVLESTSLFRLTILTFAVLGTLISMVVVGLLINATCDVHGVCSAPWRSMPWGMRVASEPPDVRFRAVLPTSVLASQS